MITAIKNSLISLIINPESFVSDDELSALMNHTTTLKIHLHGYLTIKMVHNIYGYDWYHHS